jgi:hypothetical protein
MSHFLRASLRIVHAFLKLLQALNLYIFYIPGSYSTLYKFVHSVYSWLAQSLRGLICGQAFYIYIKSCCMNAITVQCTMYMHAVCDYLSINVPYLVFRGLATSYIFKG